MSNAATALGTRLPSIISNNPTGKSVRFAPEPENDAADTTPDTVIDEAVTFWNAFEYAVKMFALGRKAEVERATVCAPRSETIVAVDVIGRPVRFAPFP